MEPWSADRDGNRYANLAVAVAARLRRRDAMGGGGRAQIFTRTRFLIGFFQESSLKLLGKGSGWFTAWLPTDRCSATVSHVYYGSLRISGYSSSRRIRSSPP